MQIKPKKSEGMNLRSCLFLSFFLYLTVALAQHKGRLIIESCALINKPLQNSEHLTDRGGGSTFNFDWKYTYYQSMGYCAKIAYELKGISKGRWALLFPMGVSYLNQVNKYKEE